MTRQPEVGIPGSAIILTARVYTNVPAMNRKVRMLYGLDAVFYPSVFSIPPVPENRGHKRVWISHFRLTIRNSPGLAPAIPPVPERM